MSHKPNSFARAVYEGQIIGPEWLVVDVETNAPISAGSQDFGHTKLGRAVLSADSQSHIGTVIDYQKPAEA